MVLLGTNEIEARGGASQEAVIRHLQQVVKIKTDQVATLKLDNDTLRMEARRRDFRYQNQLKAIREMQGDLREYRKYIGPRHLPWWKRVFRRETRNKLSA